MISIEFGGETMKADCSALVEAIQKMQDATGQSQAVCVRKGVINLLKALRKRTAQAKKSIPKRNVEKYHGSGPHYITPKGKNQISKRRYSITRRSPSVDAFSYAKVADSKTDAWSKFGKITKWGLARKSWGHAMAALFGRSDAKGGNPKARIKSGLVEGGMKEIITGNNPRVEATIINRLKYITEATPPAVLADAIKAAEKSMAQQTQHYLDKAKKGAGLR